MMSRKIRKLLYPLSILYKGVTGIRNKLYDKKVLLSKDYDTPLIVVGNLRVGGTGKSPQVLYLVDLLKKNHIVAVLSRGYKRKSTGFLLAQPTSSFNDLGDEAFQLYRRHSDVLVCVDADRNNGIKELQRLGKPPNVIILDDAFQHRKVTAGLNILLTPYDDLYVDDTHLPSGNLRENIKEAARAQIIIVTKCPNTLTEKQEFNIAVKLQATLNQTVFYSKIKYRDYVQNNHFQISVEDLKSYEIILITGIANPKPLVAYLEIKDLKFTHFSFKDHHDFNNKEIKRIKDAYAKIVSKKKIILSTEKDYVRIFASFDNLYYLAIETVFINHQKDFDKLIIDYVGANSGNSKIS
jgi:tetraacyldisaccharide 4'-kinase